jgi:hypothetical protein
MRLCHALVGAGLLLRLRCASFVSTTYGIKTYGIKTYGIKTHAITTHAITTRAKPFLQASAFLVKPRYVSITFGSFASFSAGPSSAMSPVSST